MNLHYVGNQKIKNKNSIIENSSFKYKNLFKQSIFSSTNKELIRRYPLLAATHRIIDGSLIGLIFVLVIMSIISLHGQHLWTQSFSNLESSRNLINKLKESISMLERHHLIIKSSDQSLVETKTSNLLYLKKGKEKKINLIDKFKLKLFANENLKKKYPFSEGY